MIVVVFRIHVNPEADVEELEAVSQNMVALFGKAPGCIAVKDFSAPDGEMLVLAEFDSVEAVDAWKSRPEHRIAQRRGQEEFFTHHKIQICSLVRQNEWARTGQ
jgi:heme-degrading monooxygenase HmoA